MTPRKESEAVPEEFARVVKDWKSLGGAVYDLALLVGDEMLTTENEDFGDYLKQDAKTINLAHRRAVKDAVVKAYESILEAWLDGEMHYPTKRFERYLRKLAQEAKDAR